MHQCRVLANVARHQCINASMQGACQELPLSISVQTRLPSQIKQATVQQDAHTSTDRAKGADCTPHCIHGIKNGDCNWRNGNCGFCGQLAWHTRGLVRVSYSAPDPGDEIRQDLSQKRGWIKLQFRVLQQPSLLAVACWYPQGTCGWGSPGADIAGIKTKPGVGSTAPYPGLQVDCETLPGQDSALQYIHPMQTVANSV
eukprot:1158920-Pelagomonas_calceolata.AAC.3